MPTLVASGLSQDEFVGMAVRSRKPAALSSVPLPRGASSDYAGPTHLIIVCHGVMGVPSHVAELCGAVRAALGPRALVLAPACFSGFRSLAGTEACGDAVFAALTEAAGIHKATLRHVSLMGYSFGGILARWVCGRLEGCGFLGLEPLNFVTVACPHLGIADDVGVAGGLGEALRFMVRHAGGATGEEMSQSDDGRCLLSWMASPTSPFFAGLSRFRRRSLYACLRGDRTVSFYTAYFPSLDGGGGECGDGGGDGDGCSEEQRRAMSACAECARGATPGFVKAEAAHYPHV